MSFLDWLVEDFNAAADFFYSIYLEVLDWVWPFWLAAEFFYDLSQVFELLAWDFSDFGGWVLDTVDRLNEILSWSNIRSLILGWLPDLEDVVDWWDQWWVWVGQEIDDWWSATRLIVQGWIDTVEDALNDLRLEWDDFWNITWPAWTAQFETLRAGWDNFVNNVLPNLLDLTGLWAWWNDRIADITGLIDAAFTLREGWWAGWQDVRDDVLEFFTDPLEWLWSRFTDWFLGPEV